MKILIIGGGPGGLYSGLLIKKAEPAWEITVLERNPPDATYGWGIIFSDRTLASFREADSKSYQDITDHFVIWETIRVHYRKEVVRCGGHVFAGISRQLLLNLLQRRCAEVGVQMRFGVEVSDLSEFAGFDLLIAADGASGIVRRTYAKVFQTKVAEGMSRFIWLGAGKAFDCFTYLFNENEQGLFQVHAYPFDGVRSTFIVECAEGVWRRAGLDQATELETIRYCEKVFADALGGRPLLPNNSKWLTFPTITNRTWHHRNIVLLGDTAHTAHFTIGSGTKMAMEDAIALAGALERDSDLETALKEYELERRPIVEALQKAAADSQSYFENVRRYLHLEPLPFSFYLLTRSGRISYDDLRRRDPHFAEAVDRWFVERTLEAPVCGARAVVGPPPMFTPIRLREMTLVNRVALACVSTASAEGGVPGDRHRAQFHQRMFGAGLILTEPVAVSAEGRITPGCAGMYRPEHGAAWASIVNSIHSRCPAKLAMQLGHAGRRGSTRPRWEGLDRPLREGNWPLLSASPLLYAPWSQVPKEMDAADMEKVREDFVRAARMAAEAGFDLIQLHFAHGYLLASFLSPLTNMRSDRYGGSLENRMQFPMEIFDAVRQVWPRERPVAVAVSGSDWKKGGTGVEDAVAFVRKLQEHGCDLVTVLAGQTTMDAEPTYGPGFLAPLGDQVRNEAGVPVMIGGNIITADQINTLLAAGRADLCILDPPHLEEGR